MASASASNTPTAGPPPGPPRLQQLVRKHAATLHPVTLPKSKSLGIWVIVKGQIPADLVEGLKREFTEDELASIYANVHRSVAPAAARPAALFVFGPPAVGKSSIADARAAALFGSVRNAVLIDGAEFRDVHGGYQAVAAHGKRHCVLHADAWDVFKATKLSARLKVRGRAPPLPPADTLE